MKRNISHTRHSVSPSKENNSNAAVTVAVIGLLGTIVTAYFGYLASTKPSGTEISIFATQTVEAKLKVATQNSHNANLAVPTVTANSIAVSTSSVKVFHVTVPAKADWFNTGITVSAGDILNFSASGEVDVEPPPTIHRPPDGIGDQCTQDCLLNYYSYGSLIGRIGNGQPFLIGSALKTSVPQNIKSGLIYLAINDNKPYYFDNSGAFEVKITVNDAQ